MHRNTIIVAVGIIALIGAAFFVQDRGSKNDEPQTSDFARVAGVELKTLDGETVRLGDYGGQPLVLNAWAVWCPFCKNELPEFAAIQEEFEGEVLFIAIDRLESESTIREFTDELGLTDRLLFLRDEDDAFYNAIDGFAMPETVFYDAKGNLVEHKRGPLVADGIRQRVLSIIGSP